MILVNKAVAHPWLCDVLGHLTTRHYVAMFDDSIYHLLATVFGWPGAVNESGELGWVDVRHVIEYLAEVSAGEILEIHAEIIKVGGKSMSAKFHMTNLSKMELAATFECVCVLFDMQERKGLVMTDEMRAQASKHLANNE